MPLQKPPEGTRGVRPAPHLVARLIMPLMIRLHRRSGDKFSGMDLLYLSTVGSLSGQRRTHAVMRIANGDGWVIVAAAAGTAGHPAWYHNITAHPDEVWAEVSGVKHHVQVEQLEGPSRERAWALVSEQQPRFEGYRTKTDRQFPVLRLTPLP